MKTLNEKLKQEIYVTLVGFALVAIFAVLRVLTDLTEWRQERKTKTSKRRSQ